jgi:hypothetical protein
VKSGIYRLYAGVRKRLFLGVINAVKGLLGIMLDPAFEPAANAITERGFLGG